MNFIHSFWPADNKYRESLGRLDEQFQLSVSENKHIVTFVKNWLQVQDLYGNGLKDLLGKKLFATSDKDAGDQPDDAASLGRAYKAIKENCFNRGVLHLDTSKSIREQVLNLLQKTTQDYEDIYKQMKGELLEKINQFEKWQSILEIANKNYIEKCRIADKLEENAVNEAHRQEEANNVSPKPNNTYKLRKLTFTEMEMKGFLKRAQSEGASQETKTMFLGLFRGLQSGEAIVQWLLHAYSEQLSTPADAAEVGQALIDQNLLRLIGPGSQFRLASTAFYQWKKRADEDSESPHYRARKIAGEADLHYKDAVEKTEALRMEIEEYMVALFICLLRKHFT
ncbi:Rho-GTPase-activating protein 8 [Entomophthora muscae]|uniref:Rho-GTPase-activating protein 8 n=1 Tax=Entomophthora muscae TaxID=34485 RepID=A0ACC2T9T3_9FUNG|nr:Rho-GTPase-activating protein 8 [Entomophthora muscae]